VIVADYSNPGSVVRVSPTGALLWRYGPTTGAGRLDHPSLATPLADGTILINDDFRHRLVIVDPATNTIVWQYGTTDRPGRTPGHLDVPDGHEPIPAGIAF
jgi:outer membrane protein assembly factor BamB